MVAVVVAVLHPHWINFVQFRFRRTFSSIARRSLVCSFSFLSFVLMVLALVLVLFLFSFSSIYLCWMFFFVLLRFVLFCFVDEFCSIAIIYCSVCPFVRSVVWLPLSSLFSIYPHCVCTMVYRRIWTTTKTLLIEFRCVTIFEIIFQQIFDECVLYC